MLPVRLVVAFSPPRNNINSVVPVGSGPMTKLAEAGVEIPVPANPIRIAAVRGAARSKSAALFDFIIERDLLPIGVLRRSEQPHP